MSPEPQARPGAAAPADAVPVPGYELIELLRRGNDLEVHDAWCPRRRCRVIVKSLRADRRDDAAARRRLQDEGRLLCALTHPHIVRGYEVHDEFVVLETLRGQTLGHLVEHGPRLTVEQVAHLGLHLISALANLHDHGVLHLDLKPSNVIAEAGRAKLIDLSVARAPGPVRPGVGTTYYMSPEQARGGEVTAAADVWGLGVVLFEAVTGEPAFDDPDDDGSGEVDPADVPQLHRPAPALRGPFAELVRACLAFEPAERPRLTEVAAQLEAIVELPRAERRLGRG